MQERAIGPRGALMVRQILCTTEPIKAFAEIQQKYGLQVPNSLATMQFLNLFDVSNFECHQNVLQLLVSRLLTSIEVSPPERLLTLLGQCIQCLTVEELKPVPLAILMKIQPNIPAPILSQLGADPEMLATLPVVLQRLVWEVSPTLVQQKLHALIAKHEKDELVQELVTMIGDSAKIYSLIVDFLRSNFTSSGQPSWCALRLQLLMALHSMDWPQLDVRESCHQFAWLLDTGARARDGRFEERLVEKLWLVVGGVGSNSPVFGDMAMIVAAPTIKQALLESILSGVSEVVQRQIVPAEHPNLAFVTQLLLMGLTARKILKQQKFSLPRMPDEVMGNFFPLLCCDEMTEEMDDDEPMQPSLAQHLNLPVCREIVQFYALQRLLQQNPEPLIRLCVCVLPVEAAVLVERPDFIEFLSNSSNGLVHLKVGLEQCSNLQVFLDLLLRLAPISTHVHLIGVQMVVAAKLPPSLSSFLEALWQNGLVSGSSDLLRAAYQKLGKPFPAREQAVKLHVQPPS